LDESDIDGAKFFIGGGGLFPCICIIKLRF
jgi:hypothetical protein